MKEYKLHAIITVGSSGCGKSTWAEQYTEEHPSYINIERDKIRFDMFNNGVKDWTKYKFNKTNEELVSKEHNTLLDYAFTYGYNIVLSDTWLNPKYREDMINKLEHEGYEVEIKDDWEVKCFEDLIKRNENRQGGLPINILWDQWLKYLEYKGERDTYIPNTKLPKSVIVDIDGTVADMTGIRKPFEWDKVVHDEPITQVVDIVKGLHLQGYNVIFLSGRDGCCEDSTLAWLYDVFPETPFKLFMRNPKDCRRDYIVKRELFDNHIRNEYNITMVIDDRNSVLDLWAELGIKTIDVGNRHERF